MDLPVVQRLRGIHQTSLAYLTFPTATHTRFDHSLGVCSGTKQLTTNVLGLGENETLQHELCTAALLHDIGHGPFSHLSEEAYVIKPDLFADLIYSNDLDTTSLDSVPYSNGAPHEVIGALLLCTDAANKFFDQLNSYYNIELDGNRIGDIITGNGLDGSFEASSIVNGPFDADKIDYLRRDSTFSGIPIALDVDRLIHSLEAKTDQDSGKAEVAIKAQGVVSAEQIIFGKAVLYSTVYHHHKVWAADCVFKAAIERMFATGKGIYNDSIKDPADMLHYMDSDFTRWVTRRPQSVTDRRLALALERIAKRDLPVRILDLSSHTIDDVGLSELFRYRNPDPDRANEAYKQLLELRQEIADEVRQTTKDDTLFEDEIWIDLPRTPQLGDGAIIGRDGRLMKLSDLFPTRQWVDYYKLHRYVGYLFGPRRHRDVIGKVAQEIIKDRRIEIKQSPN